ncbi:hypothetical protein NBRC116493_03640 [Aurantivibrio infirmus]
MEEEFQALAALGAGEFEHLDGSLIQHLKGTQQLLESWGASKALQNAGLFHAAYGTAGFEQSLVSADQRTKIADIIGSAAEEIVYQYCACDREDFFAKIGRDNKPEFKNRFTKESYYLSAQTFRDFCELTAANETEIAIDNEEFLGKYGNELNRLFARMAPFLCESAQRKTKEIFSDW